MMCNCIRTKNQLHMNQTNQLNYGQHNRRRNDCKPNRRIHGAILHDVV